MRVDFGRLLDHTLLRPTATPDDVRQLCTEARKHAMAAVCVFPSHVRLAADVLSDTRIRVATVIAFPFGATFIETKTSEMENAAGHGAHEADIVINISMLKAGNDSYVEHEMQLLTNAARKRALVTKFIVEMCFLNHDEKARICSIANRVRPDFIKTSTGYGTYGATVEDVTFLRTALRPEIQIKAAGGVRSYSTAAALLQAGATRIGTSSGVAIVEEARNL